MFGVTFLAGEVFNLYSQPQDPQMQVNVMAWVTPAWALVLLAAHRRWPARGLAALAALTVALFAYNVWSIAPLRGLDSKWRGAIERLEQQGDPVSHRLPAARFRLDDGLCLAALGHDGARRRRARPRPAGAAEVQMDRLHRRRAAPSRLEHRAACRRTCAGRSIARWSWATRCWSCGLWDIPEAQLLTETGMVADAGRLGALQRMLRTDYVATPVSVDPVAGSIYRLQRAAGR